MSESKSGKKMGKRNLPHRIKQLRLKLGLTQEQFAAHVGVTFSTVNRWENGKSEPSPLALAKIRALEDRR